MSEPLSDSEIRKAIREEVATLGAREARIAQLERVVEKARAWDKAVHDREPASHIAEALDDLAFAVHNLRDLDQTEGGTYAQRTQDEQGLAHPSSDA